MNLPYWLCWLFLSFALIGLVCLVLILIFWSQAGRFVGDTWAKLITEGLQLCSGATSIGGAFAAINDKPGWFSPAIAGTISLSVWKLVQVFADNRIKAVDKFNKSELARAERESAARTRLLYALRKAVNEKVKRLRKALVQRGARPSVPQIRNALTPHPHLDELLEAMGILFQELFGKADSELSNIRVGLYVDHDGAMTPIHGVSLQDPGYNPFTSYQSHQNQFRLSCTENPSNVVRAIREKRMIIVENCGELAKANKFFYFDKAQEGYLHSMIACYIGDICVEPGKMAQAVLAIDSDVVGYFREADRKTLHFCIREFASRLKLELLLVAMLAQRETNS